MIGARVGALALCILTAACNQAPSEPTIAGAASRLVTLAPQLTELVFAAGAGESLVGVSAWSDFPRAALALPVVSDAFTVDQEQLAELQPDLILAWQSGTPAHVVDELRLRGYRVEVVATESLGDIGAAINTIGSLTGHDEFATDAARKFGQSLEEIAEKHADDVSITVFYQVSGRPLYTVNGKHYISEIVALCGGRTVFSELGELAPAVSVEAVLERDPEVLLAGSEQLAGVFDEWARWPQLAANRYGNLFVVDPDTISRASPRLVAGARSICARLDLARDNRRRKQSSGEAPSERSTSSGSGVPGRGVFIIGGAAPGPDWF
jgi:iron complex transport system substrate-binding protein